MLHLRPLPPEPRRCDLRVKNAIRRETTDCLRRDIEKKPYTPPARFAPPPVSIGENEPVAQPWHTYND